MDFIRDTEELSSFVDLGEHGSILGVQFSPYEWSQDIILIAFKNKIFVGRVNFDDVLELKKLAQFTHNDVCTAMCLSPETSVKVVPVNIQFCTAGKEDFALRVFKGNLNEDNTCKVLRGHKNYINDVTYDSENTYLASTGDDCTVKTWSLSDDYECISTFNLTSPGMSIGCHREDASKLLVAEKNGIMRFYNINTQRPIISLDLGKPLSAAHWSSSDSKIIGSLNMGELILWDITRPSCPKETLVYTQNGGYIKFSPLGELVATVNKLEGCLRVTHIPTLHPRLTAKLSLPTNISWHFRLPIMPEVPLPKEDIEAQETFITPQPDPRFQMQNQAHNCYSKYIDYHRCMILLGSRNTPCEFFLKQFTSLCPNMWIEKWDEQRSEGTFPYDFPKKGVDSVSEE